jgi:predicted dehydrogenase
MTQKINRRTFTKAGAAATLSLTAASARKTLGANERIRLGFIGVANRGGQLMRAFSDHADMEIVALCDVCRSTLEAANGRLDGKADTYGDFRKLIDRSDLDGVVIATPDHWHAIQTITACDAGKDVYVEKPLSITVVEGRKMVEAARRNNRVVQVGLHRRSAELYAQAGQMVRDGELGKVTVCRAYHRSNMTPKGIGHCEPTEPPADLDWDMWLGPRPMRRYQANLAPYKFRWWRLYSSQTANNGVHFLDCLRWITGDVAPTSICAMGGVYAVDDDRTIPDTLQTIYEFPAGRLVMMGMYETNGNRTLPAPGYFELRGTIGTMYCGDPAFEIIPERGGQFQDRAPRRQPLKVEDTGRNASHTSQHARNFLDCIKSRKRPNCDVEEGHRSTTMALLSKISWLTRSRLEWDPEKEQCVGNDEANSMLHYEYRKPWTLG